MGRQQVGAGVAPSRARRLQGLRLVVVIVVVALLPLFHLARLLPCHRGRLDQIGNKRVRRRVRKIVTFAKHREERLQQAFDAVRTIWNKRRVREGERLASLDAFAGKFKRTANGARRSRLPKSRTNGSKVWSSSGTIRVAFSFDRPLRRSSPGRLVFPSLHFSPLLERGARWVANRGGRVEVNEASQHGGRGARRGAPGRSEEGVDHGAGVAQKEVVTRMRKVAKQECEDCLCRSSGIDCTRQRVAHIEGWTADLAHLLVRRTGCAGNWMLAQWPHWPLASTRKMFSGFGAIASRLMASIGS